MNTSYEARASNAVSRLANESPSLAASSRDDGFLAMLGHEMRNPLSALSNALELWPSTTHDAFELAELRSLVQRQVEQLVRLSEDFVNVARGERMLDCRRDRVDLKRTVESACEQVRPYAERHGHTLTLNLPDRPMMVFGDALRLIQAVANLIQNAAKFMNNVGRIDVIVERQAEWFAITVRDNGAGIEASRLPSIFETDPERSREYSASNDGLGIGLPLVKRIVDSHGGNITAQSDGPGLGSEFTVYLPTQSAAPVGEASGSSSLAAASRPRRRQLPPQRILVVDDQRCLAGLLAKLLRSLGQTVTVSGDGASAIQTALDERPDIVFLDIVMCGLDGYEVARRLREIPALDGVWLVAVSGRSDEGSMLLAFESGFDDYLVKPVSISELAELLEDANPVAPPREVCTA